LNQRNLLILVGALALVALAVLLLDRGGQRQLDEGDLLLPGLSESLNDVSEVVLRRSGNAVMVTLAQTADGWVVSDRGNYPANFSRLRQNLRGLAEARIFESKTSNPEFYERLGVRDINDSLATGTEFTITSPTVSAQVIVGRTDEGVRARARTTGWIRRCWTFPLPEFARHRFDTPMARFWPLPNRAATPSITPWQISRQAAA
jgi:hypothetical protein